MDEAFGLYERLRFLVMVGEEGLDMGD